MRVLFDCERMKHPHTGLFEYCARLGKALQTTAGREDEVAYYVPRGYEAYFGDTATYYTFREAHKFFPLRVAPTDVWHTNAQAALIKPASGMKRLVTIHDLNFLYEKTSPAKIRKRLTAFQQNVDRADAVVTISRYAQADIERHLHLDGKSVFVIYNGCRVSEFPGYDRPVYRPEAPFLFSIGTVLPKKNFHVLPCLLRDNDCELLIAGKGDARYAQAILAEAKKHGVEQRVKLIGPVRDEDKYWYLKRCTAFLFPSIAEGFGIPPLEAMCFGKPVFLSVRTSLPEIGGRYAYYFADFDPEAMRSVFASGMAHYARLRPESEIIRHARRFNWEASAKAYWDVYETVARL